MNLERHPNRARPLMAPPESLAVAEARIHAKPPITEEVMQSIRKDVNKRLAPFDRKFNRQRGLTKKLARTKICDKLHCFVL